MSLSDEEFRDAILKDVSNHMAKLLEDHYLLEDERHVKYIADLEAIYLKQYEKMLAVAPKVPTLVEHAAISALNGLLSNNKLQGRPSEFAKDAVIIAKFLLAELENDNAKSSEKI